MTVIKQDQLEEYREFAINKFPDFPNVKTCGNGSIYWCITEGYRGLELANQDLHGLIKELQK